MVFKGTDRRSQYDVAREFDSIGGVLDAFTGKEYTAYFCKVMSEQTAVAVDLLTDLFMSPSFPEHEIEREKQVVCQEIYQVEDSPEDLAHEMLGAMLWENNPLGQPVLGVVPTVMSFDRSKLLQFKDKFYNTAETVVCAAGDIRHQEFVDLLAPYMADLSNGSPHLIENAPNVGSLRRIVPKDLEQVHLCIGLQGPGAVDDSRYAASILNAVLGGGMSSRLYQEVREKNGLAYAIGSYMYTFSDIGVLGVYAGCEPDLIEELIRITSKEIRELPGSLTEEEVQTAKNQVKGAIILSLESSGARMSRLARDEYYFGRFAPIEESLSALDKLTLKDVAETAEKILDTSRLTGVALGPVDPKNDLFSSFDI